MPSTCWCLFGSWKVQEVKSAQSAIFLVFQLFVLFCNWTECICSCFSRIFMKQLKWKYCKLLTSSSLYSGFHDKEIWRISVRLSDRSEVTQHKINFIKKFPGWVWTHDLLVISLMLCQLSKVGIFWRFLKWSLFCFIHHCTCWNH